MGWARLAGAAILVILAARGAARAEGSPERHRLPARGEPVAGERITLDATIESVSSIPTLAQLAPYDEAITFIEYRVDRIVDGRYDDQRIVIAHWCIREREPTAAAKWQPGLKQTLTVELFDMDPARAQVAAAIDGVDLDLVPYWALAADHAKQ
jgi:hypothetical protein